MKKIALNLMFLIMVSSCTDLLTKVDDSVNSGPTIDGADVSGSVGFCEHKYSDDRDFYYKERVRSEFEVQEHMVVNFTFTLLDDTERYLSGTEFANYECKVINIENN